MQWLALFGLMVVELVYVPLLVRITRRRSAAELGVVAPLVNVALRLGALVYCIAIDATWFSAVLIVGLSVRTTVLLQIAAYRRVPSTDQGAALGALPFLP